eukprot:1140046-Pelagomonas_calceolata.AAC.2
MRPPAHILCRGTNSALRHTAHICLRSNAAFPAAFTPVPAAAFLVELAVILRGFKNHPSPISACHASGH